MSKPKSYRTVTVEYFGLLIGGAAVLGAFALWGHFHPQSEPGVFPKLSQAERAELNQADRALRRDSARLRKVIGMTEHKLPSPAKAGVSWRVMGPTNVHPGQRVRYLLLMDYVAPNLTPQSGDTRTTIRRYVSATVPRSVRHQYCFWVKSVLFKIQSNVICSRVITAG